MVVFSSFGMRGNANYCSHSGSHCLISFKRMLLAFVWLNPPKVNPQILFNPLAERRNGLQANEVRERMKETASASSFLAELSTLSLSNSHSIRRSENRFPVYSLDQKVHAVSDETPRRASVKLLRDQFRVFEIEAPPCSEEFDLFCGKLRGFGATFAEMQKCLNSHFSDLGPSCKQAVTLGNTCDFVAIREACPGVEADSAHGAASCMERIAVDIANVGKAKLPRAVLAAFSALSAADCAAALRALPIRAQSEQKGPDSRHQEETEAFVMDLGRPRNQVLFVEADTPSGPASSSFVRDSSLRASPSTGTSSTSEIPQRIPLLTSELAQHFRKALALEATRGLSSEQSEGRVLRGP